MEATPVAQRGHTRLQFLFENHPFRHLVRAAEILRQARDRAMTNARINVACARETHFEPHAEMYRRVARTYIWIARQRNRRLLEQCRQMREVSP